MLNVAFELIGEATSNSLLMFCFCNLIIVMILTGSSKPGSMDNSKGSTFTTPVSFSVGNIASDDHDSRADGDDDEEMIVVDVSSAQDESLIDASSSSDEDEDKESSHCFDDDDEEEDEKDEDKDDDDDCNEADVEEEEGDDDLRKRVEEFIAKINNEWRHEKLRALNLVY